MDRDASLERLRRETFDLLVIGGGITGCGIALDAAQRGLKVGLIERDDFSSGTSSKSSKLIHGGLRYLRQLQFKVTIEASREKARLKKMAPHLVEDLPFLLPHWTRAARPMDRLGLWIYDAAAGFPKGADPQALEPAATLETLSGAHEEGLRGGFLYYDARADDCRLVSTSLQGRRAGRRPRQRPSRHRFPEERLPHRRRPHPRHRHRRAHGHQRLGGLVATRSAPPTIPAQEPHDPPIEGSPPHPPHPALGAEDGRTCSPPPTTASSS
jgi:choline dehydrogenase-like flavoprotein